MPTTPTPTLRLVGAAAIVAALGLGAAAWLLPGLRTTMAQAPTKAVPAPVDGDRAYGYLKDVCKIGPHAAGSEGSLKDVSKSAPPPAGSPANTRVRAMVADHFRKLGGKVREQPLAG